MAKQYLSFIRWMVMPFTEDTHGAIPHAGMTYYTREDGMQKKLVFRFLALAVALLFFVQTLDAAPVKVADGTMVQVRLLETLTSGKAKENSIVNYAVTQDVVVDGQVVIAKGARATGKVLESRGRGMFGKNGVLEFSIDSVKAVDGTALQLRPNSQGGAGRSNVTGMILGAIFLTIFMVFVNGRDVTVKANTEFPAYIDGDFKVEVEPSEEVIEATMPNATLTVIDKTSTENAVIGKIRNDGPDAACAEIVVIVEKDGKAVGVGKALTPTINATDEKLFSVDIKGSTDGTLVVQANVKPTGAILPTAAPVADVAILSKIITDKEVAGKIKNTSDKTLDITVSATCADNGKIVGTGSVKVKGVTPGDEKDYIISIKGKTATDVSVTVEAEPSKK